MRNCKKKRKKKKRNQKVIIYWKKRRNPRSFSLFPSALSFHENKYTARRPCWYGNMTKKLESPVWDARSPRQREKEKEREKEKACACAPVSLHDQNIANQKKILLILSIALINGISAVSEL